ncbi:hypothetical protein VNO78_14801 [Psophocarpus tetragonolobus]|uniref:Disease resistance R13L4/SHOC-2-like LRR domain-containing protein n=1 Tax=Psophocarpus tetragonolobus TaxID=3891 RepID=A0AAN9SER8_PSOTE
MRRKADCLALEETASKLNLTCRFAEEGVEIVDYHHRVCFLKMADGVVAFKTTDGDGGEDLSVEELKKKVAQWLKGKKYLVVLDEVKGAFPDDHTGSRILIIRASRMLVCYTQNPKVALHSTFKTMIHLRYLRIETGVSHIPASIGSLRNLETLDIRYEETVSNEIRKLKRLRSLYLRGGAKLPELK